MEVSLRIQRFDPATDTKPHFETYAADVEPMDRVLDALNYVKWNVDGTLTYRFSCAHAVCGSDAMMINGENALACQKLIKDVRPERTIVIEPIRGLAIERDLIVDMDPFFDSYESVMPYLVNTGPDPDRERLQSPEDHAVFDDTTKCILCAACTTSCPVFWGNGRYVGPATIVNAHRFIFDSRDDAAAERLDVLSENSGVFRCRTAFNCTEACPRDINVTEAVQEVKREILYRRS